MNDARPVSLLPPWVGFSQFTHVYAKEIYFYETLHTQVGAPAFLPSFLPPSLSPETTSLCTERRSRRRRCAANSEGQKEASPRAPKGRRCVAPPSPLPGWQVRPGMRLPEVFGLFYDKVRALCGHRETPAALRSALHALSSSMIAHDMISPGAPVASRAPDSPKQ